MSCVVKFHNLSSQVSGKICPLSTQHQGRVHRLLWEENHRDQNQFFGGNALTVIIKNTLSLWRDYLYGSAYANIRKVPGLRSWGCWDKNRLQRARVMRERNTEVVLKGRGKNREEKAARLVSWLNSSMPKKIWHSLTFTDSCWMSMETEW